MEFKPLSRLRTFLQFVFAIGMNGYVSGWIFKPHLYSGSAKGIVPPVLNCYACPGTFVSCPAGSIQHFMVIKAIPYYVLGLIILVGASVGRLFCGWACPFGLVQDLLYKIKTKKFRLPRWMRFGKYLFLIFTVFLIPYLISDTFFCKLCPQGALEGGIPQMLLNAELHHLAGLLYWSKVVILAVVVLASIFIKRPFCRAVCPVGALLAPFNRVSILQMKVDGAACTGCGWCQIVCPVDINVSEDPNSLECIRCGLCTSCPTSAVKFTTIFGKPSTLPKTENFLKIDVD